MYYIKKSIKDVPDYSIPARKTNILLDGNELTYPMPENIKNEIIEEIKTLPLNLYPPTELIDELIVSIADYFAIHASNIILGVGSSGLLSVICSAIGEPGDKVLVPVPSFSVYSQYILSGDKRLVKLEVNENFEINLPELKKIIDNELPKMVILPYPNNPNGNLFSDDVVDYLLNEYSGVLCVDEVYCHYARKSLLNQINNHDNLIVLRSFSKIGLASCRIGFIAASPKFTKEIKKGVLPYSINTLSAVAAKAIIRNFKDIEALVDLVIQERDRVVSALSQLPDAKIYKSKANFILGDFGAKAFDLAKLLLKEYSISIRDFPKGTRLENFLRITIGTPEENNILIKGVYSFYDIHIPPFA